MNLKNTKNTKGNIRRRLACFTLIALLITPLIGFGATQNVTEENQSIALPVPENETTPKTIISPEYVTILENTTAPENVTIPENVTTSENVTEGNETQPEPENITDRTAPTITILSPLSSTYNTTAINLNYTIDEPADWIGYSLNGADNVTIFMRNITFNAIAGLNICNYTEVYTKI